MITAVKKAECGEGLVVRFYDAHDCKSNVTLRVPDAYRRAYLCDLMEREIREVELRDGCVTVPVSNFEIVTLKFLQEELS